MMKKISFLLIAKKLSLKPLSCKLDDLKKVWIFKPGINRGGLQLAGFIAKSKSDQIVILGSKENEYISAKTPTEITKIYTQLIKSGCPVIIISPSFKNKELLLEIARKFQFPILKSPLPSTELMVKLSSTFNTIFAPTTQIHGCLLNIFGTGTLITGKSGIGKSEVVYTLMRRGHFFIADDAVEIKEIDQFLYGSAPKITKNILEIRGIGFIDIAKIFGQHRRMDETRIDCVINLDKNIYKSHQAITFENPIKYKQILNVNLKNFSIDVNVAKNIADIIELCVIVANNTNALVNPNTL